MTGSLMFPMDWSPPTYPYTIMPSPVPSILLVLLSPWRWVTSHPKQSITNYQPTMHNIS
jgi:hypothetical protein